MLLKLDSLIIILFSGLLVPVFYVLYKERNESELPLMIVSTIVMILVFFFEALAYKSVSTNIYPSSYANILLNFFIYSH